LVESGTTNQEDNEYESHRNLIGVFEILMDTDKRLHPENYKSIVIVDNNH